MVSPAYTPAGGNNIDGKAPRWKVSSRALLVIAVAVVNTAALAFLHAAAWAAHEGAWDAAVGAAPPLAISAPKTPSGRASFTTTAPIGHLGPKNTKRANLNYYDTLFFTALQFGGDAASLLEVGCSADPFIKHLDWIDGRRVCVAPYFVDYNSGGGHGSSAKRNTQLTMGAGGLGKKSIERVKADFMHYVVPRKFDLLLCGQVVEHVQNPGAFVKKLIRSARTSIISVPYMWNDCGELCNHITHKITYKMILKWSAPELPLYSTIVAEKTTNKNRMHRRMIVVFRPEDRRKRTDISRKAAQ